MPLALLFAGIVFLIAGTRGKTCNGDYCAKVLLDTIKSDFTGPNNFFIWGIALFMIGAIGYYKPLKPVSNAFLTLVIIALFFANKGFFKKFMADISSTQQTGGSGQTVNASFNPFDLISGNSAPAKGNSILQQYENAVPDSGATLLLKALGV
jgi:hypothetical protein